MQLTIQQHHAPPLLRAECNGLLKPVLPKGGKSRKHILAIHQAVWLKAHVMVKRSQPGMQPRVPGMSPAPPFPVFSLLRQQVTVKKAYVTHAIAALFNPLRPGYSPYTG